MKKIAFALAAIGVLAVGCNQTASTNSTSQVPTSTTTNTAPTSSAVTPTGNGTTPATPGAMSAAPGNTSDASLNAGLGNVDSQMNGMNTDNANATSAMNQQNNQ